jgi:hypothetical protein
MKFYYKNKIKFQFFKENLCLLKIFSLNDNKRKFLTQLINIKFLLNLHSDNKKLTN